MFLRLKDHGYSWYADFLDAIYSYSSFSSRFPRFTKIALRFSYFGGGLSWLMANTFSAPRFQRRASGYGGGGSDLFAGCALWMDSRRVRYPLKTDLGRCRNGRGCPPFGVRTMGLGRPCLTPGFDCDSCSTAVLYRARGQTSRQYNMLHVPKCASTNTWITFCRTKGSFTASLQTVQDFSEETNMSVL